MRPLQHVQPSLSAHPEVKAEDDALRRAPCRGEEQSQSLLVSAACFARPSNPHSSDQCPEMSSSQRMEGDSSRASSASSAFHIP